MTPVSSTAPSPPVTSRPPRSWRGRAMRRRRWDGSVCGDAYLWGDGEQYLRGRPMGIRSTRWRRRRAARRRQHGACLAVRRGQAVRRRSRPRVLVERDCPPARASAAGLRQTARALSRDRGSLRSRADVRADRLSTAKCAAWCSRRPPASSRGKRPRGFRRMSAAGSRRRLQEVLAVAQRQLRFVRSRYPGATGKMLTVARVGPTGIAKRSVPLLIGDERAA